MPGECTEHRVKSFLQLVRPVQERYFVEIRRRLERRHEKLGDAFESFTIEIRSRFILWATEEPVIGFRALDQDLEEALETDITQDTPHGTTFQEQFNETTWIQIMEEHWALTAQLYVYEVDLKTSGNRISREDVSDRKDFEEYRTLEQRFNQLMEHGVCRSEFYRRNSLDLFIFNIELLGAVAHDFVKSQRWGQYFNNSAMRYAAEGFVDQASLTGKIDELALQPTIDVRADVIGGLVILFYTPNHPQNEDSAIVEALDIVESLVRHVTADLIVGYSSLRITNRVCFIQNETKLHMLHITEMLSLSAELVKVADSRTVDIMYRNLLTFYTLFGILWGVLRLEFLDPHRSENSRISIDSTQTETWRQGFQANNPPVWESHEFFASSDIGPPQMVEQTSLLRGIIEHLHSHIYVSVAQFESQKWDSDVGRLRDSWDLVRRLDLSHIEGHINTLYERSLRRNGMDTF